MKDLNQELLRNAAGQMRILQNDPAIEPAVLIVQDRAAALGQLREARAQALGLLEMLSAVVDGDLSLAMSCLDGTDLARPTDLRVMGDLAALRAWIEAMDRLVARIPVNGLRRFLWSALPRRMRVSDRLLTAEARRRVTAALDAQERRVIGGELISIVDPGVLREAIDIDAVMSRLAKTF